MLLTPIGQNYEYKNTTSLGVDFVRTNSVSKNLSDKSFVRNSQRTNFLPQYCDRVEFRGIKPISTEDIKNFEYYLYRTIGKEEYKKLLKGKTIKKEKFTSCNPMGWLGKNWITTGFKHGFKDTYFVTFKPNRFPKKRVQSPDSILESLTVYDKRHILLDGYDISDVESIRKGHNSLGEIVWASSDKIISDDLKAKQQSIPRLIAKVIQDKNLDMQNSDEYGKLCNYAKEFPEIMRFMLDLGFAKDKLLFLISYSRNKDYLPYVHSAIQKTLAQKQNLDYTTIDYLSECGDKTSLKLILKALENEYRYQGFDLGYLRVLNSLVEKKDIPHLTQLALNSNAPVRLNILGYFSTEKRCIKQGLKIARQTLREYTDIATWKDKKEQIKGKELLCECAVFLKNHGNKKDIPLLKLYSDDYEFKFEFTKAIEELKRM